MLVTNGTRLSDAYLESLQGHLDWVVLSIDSPHDMTHIQLGRTTRQGPISASEYVRIAMTARHLGIRLKVNTVISKANAHEDFSELIRVIQPERWKLLQMLPVAGQNDGSVDPLLVDVRTFKSFVSRHERLCSSFVDVVAEDNEAMTGSYAMVDPAGRFFDNTAGRHTYSSSILDVGVDAAWSQVTFDYSRFRARGGVYQW
jgi:radical S-adenosyl methionine domain-containing protein 2